MRLARLIGALILVAMACDPRTPAAPGHELGDLPLVEVPTARAGGRLLGLVISGDGNWADLIAGLSRTLADSGIPIVGLEARSYLEHGRTPERTAADMERVLRAYLARWERDEILIAGYSRGADLAPFIVNRLPEDLKHRVRLVALLSPSTTANFHFHWIDLVRSVRRATDVPLAPEIADMGDVRVLCVYGRAERDSLCPAAAPGRVHSVAREGGHRTSDYRLLARLVLTELSTR